MSSGRTAGLVCTCSRSPPLSLVYSIYHIPEEAGEDGSIFRRFVLSECGRRLGGVGHKKNAGLRRKRSSNRGRESQVLAGGHASEAMPPGRMELER